MHLYSCRELLKSPGLTAIGSLRVGSGHLLSITSHQEHTSFAFQPEGLPGQARSLLTPWGDLSPFPGRTLQFIRQGEAEGPPGPSTPPHPFPLMALPPPAFTFSAEDLKWWASHKANNAPNQRCYTYQIRQSVTVKAVENQNKIKTKKTNQKIIAPVLSSSSPKSLKNPFSSNLNFEFFPKRSYLKYVFPLSFMERKLRYHFFFFYLQ